jgi:hypothetical protein
MLLKIATSIFAIILFTIFIAYDLQAQIDKPTNEQTNNQKLIDSLAMIKANSIVKFKMDSIKTASNNLVSKPIKKNPAITFQFVANSQVNTGNVNRVLVNGIHRFQYRNPHHIYKLNADINYIYGEKDNRKSEDDLIANLNHSFWYEKNIYGIIFSTYEFSNLRGINNRYLIGAGLGWQAIRIDAEKAKKLSFVPYMSITNAIVYESTDFLRFTDIEVFRNSTRVLANFSFFKGKLLFNNTIFIQPSLSNSNFRGSWTNVFRLPLSSWFSLQSTLDYSYESLVLTGRQNSDVRLLIGFTFGNM